MPSGKVFLLFLSCCCLGIRAKRAAPHTPVLTEAPVFESFHPSPPSPSHQLDKTPIIRLLRGGGTPIIKNINLTWTLKMETRILGWSQINRGESNSPKFHNFCVRQLQVIISYSGSCLLLFFLNLLLGVPKV